MCQTGGFHNQLIGSASLAMGGQLPVDAIQHFDLLSHVVEKSCPERRNLAAGFAHICVQGRLGKRRQHKLVVAANQDDQAHEAETKIFKDGISAWTDRNFLKGAIILSLDTNLWDAALTDGLVCFHGTQIFGCDVCGTSEPQALQWQLVLRR